MVLHFFCFVIFLLGVPNISSSYWDYQVSVAHVREVEKIRHAVSPQKISCNNKFTRILQHFAVRDCDPTLFQFITKNS